MFLSREGIQLDLGLKGSQLRGRRTEPARRPLQGSLGIQEDDGGVDPWGKSGGAEWLDSESILRNTDSLDGGAQMWL